jgi:hypothetical protein
VLWQVVQVARIAFLAYRNCKEVLMSADEEDPGLHAVDGVVVDVLRLPKKREHVEGKRVPLFYIDDQAYTVPAKPHPTLGLRYLHILKTEGQGQATYFLMNEMLGKEGYVALMEYDELTEEEYDQVLDKATKMIMGPKERPKARRSRGGRSA